MSVNAGSRLGLYEITAAIGAGGMGEVYRAKDTRLGRDVAIKVLPATFAQDPERLARFEREARLLASLNHSNIAHVYGFESATLDSGTKVHFLAMEMVLGEDLAERLRRGALPVDEAIAAARQIADGLEEAHEHGIIHRDLKPANIKLTPDGKVKVLDFGLAKAFTSDGASGGSPEISHSPTMTHQGTEAGMILGTAAYMSPEQARGKTVDRRADIWSFGVVLFEMLSGKRLFAGETVSDTLAAVLRQDVDWSLLPKDLPPSQRRLIERCLERDPKKRLRDIGEARLALETADSGARPVHTASPEVSRPDRGRLRGWLIGAAVAIAAALGGIAVGRGTVPAPAAQTFTPRTFVAQAIFNARFMPDGQTMIVSSALTGNSPSLFESRTGAAAPRPFGPPRTHLLSVSKSGELAVLTNVDYLAQRLMRGTLARMTVDGAPRAIAEDVREADWLPDGSDLAVIRDTGGRDQLEFPIGHVVYQVAGYLSDPRVSPDGTRVAFMEHPAKFDNRGFVKVVDRAGGVTTVAGEFAAEEGVAWSVDGRSVLFAGAGSDAAVEFNIFRAPAIGGGEPVSLVGSAGSLYLHDIAPDGRMAVTREDIRLGVVARGVLQDAERDLTPLDQAWRPKLSADGRFTVFGDGHGGRDYALMLRNVDGSPPARLGDGNPGDISADGRWVTATLFSSGRCVVYPTGAGAMVPIESGRLEACQNAIWFPDAKSLLITGHETGKPARAYRAAFPGGTPQALLPEGLDPQGISKSGLRVLVQDASRAWQLFEIGGVASPVKGLLPGDVLVEWAADEKTVVVADTRGIPALVHQVRFDTGLRTKLGELAPADRAGLTSVVPSAYRDGGRQYAYEYVRRVSTLYLVNAAR